MGCLVLCLAWNNLSKHRMGKKKFPGGSQTAILADLETIWLHAIENLLKIPKSDLPKYRAVLIIPALYKRSLIKHYMVTLSELIKPRFVIKEFIEI